MAADGPYAVRMNPDGRGSIARYNTRRDYEMGRISSTSQAQRRNRTAFGR